MKFLVCVEIWCWAVCVKGEVIKYDFENEVILRDESGYAIKCEPGEIGLLVCEINELNRFAGYVNNPEATEAKITEKSSA